MDSVSTLELIFKVALLESQYKKGLKLEEIANGNFFALVREDTLHVKLLRTSTRQTNKRKSFYCERRLTNIFLRGETKQSK